ncbi:tRNA cytosine-5-methylases and related enzymes of the NOL1/NOP2/sun superfamily [Phaffia rhodozyma]|uniref:tRNA cytosine-5-methylases and related enzymes of the NOL1/NOP2/sun superfamily n=1 Tax=Phaffia rhodozyma TaxID=264483 RepID=A0A0F7SMH1_PHARH|nr:tRNA cytosine-5-methylases and related enzymes of the NOL1/NOP2/sun superfamily [Phaffia rhodozyma]
MYVITLTRMTSAISSARAASPKSSLPSLPTLPAEFISFLRSNGLPTSTYTSLLTYALANRPTPSSKPSLPSRFIHPTFHPTHSRPSPLQISTALNIPPEDLTPISWLPSPQLEFYRLPGSVRMAPCELYKQGRVQALDAGSAVAVHALSLDPDDHVLDLCCAPGGKLSLCAEIVRLGRGTVTGVDVSASRLGITKSVLGKLGNGSKTRLFLADGRAFDIGVARGNVYWRGKEFGLGVDAERVRDEKEDETWAGWERGPVWDEDKVEVRTKGYLIPQTFKRGRIEVGQIDTSVFVPYDKVLVDAECTHDGSIAHILKYITIEPPSPSSPNGQPTFAFPSALLASLSTASPSSTLPDLQLNLLRNGFRLLKPNGVLVYSTCSLSVNQGEVIVQRFLDELNKEGERVKAQLEDVPGREEMPCEEPDVNWLEGKALRFSGKLVEGKEKDWLSGLA